MSNRKIVADSLWLCLCPSFNRVPLRRRYGPLSLVNSTIGHSGVVARSISSSTITICQQQNGDAVDHSKEHSDPADEKSHSASCSLRDAGCAEGAPSKRMNRRRIPISETEDGLPPRKWIQPKQIPRNLRERTTANLENILQNVVNERPDHRSAIQIIQELIRHRHIQPQARHYKAMILANVDAYRGSVVQVKSLLKEMEDNNIPIDSGTLHAALKVLAIHPDYLLRQEILHKLRDRWLPLSPAGWHNVVVGLIRERQYELAMDWIDRMEAQNIEVSDWLYGLLIYNLCDAEEFDEVVNMMRLRINNGYQLSPNLWFHVLDTASEALHEEATTYVWKQRVELGFLNPSYGVCENILTITSRTGNTELATSVFRILGERNASFVLSDYEALVDTYVMAGDLDSAFRILCMIKNTNVELEESSTRSILTHMIHTDMEPWAAWQFLKWLQTEEKRNIPIAAAHVIIELCAHRRAMNEALDIYKELHTVCHEGPETATFNNLFNVCRHAQKHDICTFLIQEMILLKVLPNRMTYETLILFCVDLNRYEEAYKYLVEMTGSGFSLGEAARKHVRTKCYDSNDTFAKQLQFDAGVRKPISTSLKTSRQQSTKEKRQVGTKTT